MRTMLHLATCVPCYILLHATPTSTSSAQQIDLKLYALGFYLGVIFVANTVRHKAPKFREEHIPYQRRMQMHFFGSNWLHCSQFRSMGELHHFFRRYFLAGKDFHSLKPSLWLLDWGFSCWLLFCRFLHLPLVSCFSCNCNVHKLHGFITIYWGTAC